MKKVIGYLPAMLILVGAACIMFSLVSSEVATGGVGFISLVVGVIFYFRGKNMRSNLKSALGVVGLVISMALFSGCGTLKVPMNPYVGNVVAEEIIPLEAALMISESTANYTFRGTPESFTGSARTHEFPLGEALEKASVHTFSQVFEKVALVRTSKDAKKYKVIIEPEITDFHFRYDQLSYVGFGVAVLSKIRVKVVLESEGTKIWEKTIESPEQKRGPWMINVDYTRDVGESASAALVYTLEKIAEEISRDPAVRRLAEN